MRFKLFGPETPLTETARAIVAEDLEELAMRVALGWNIDKKFHVCGSTWELPLTLALVENKLRVLDWLLERKVDLNVEGSPAVVTAVRNCGVSTVEKLVVNGARVDLFDHVGKSAYSAALHSRRFDLLPVLLRMGLRVDVDQGKSLRQAAANSQFEAARFFIDNGLDPDAHVPDMVFPNNPTAVAVAAERGDLDIVRYLVEHGADISLKDAWGDRPYSLAAANGHEEVKAYLRAREDPCLHDVAHRATELRRRGLPADLVDFLCQPDLRMECAGEAPRFLVFHDVLGVREMKWDGRILFDLLAVAEDRWERGFLVWSPEDGKLAHADIEGDQFRVLCSWPEFTADPRGCVDAILDLWKGEA